MTIEADAIEAEDVQAFLATSASVDSHDNTSNDDDFDTAGISDSDNSDDDSDDDDGDSLPGHREKKRKFFSSGAGAGARADVRIVIADDPVMVDEDAANEVPEAVAAAAEADAIEAEEVQALLATPGIDDGTSAEDQEPSSDDEQLSNDDDDEDEMECDFPPPAAPPSVTRTHVAGAYNEFERLSASRQFERVQGSVHHSVHDRMSQLLERVHKQKKRASRGESKNLHVSRVRITGEPPSEMLMEAIHSRILEVEGHRATHDAFSQGVIAPVCMQEVTGGTIVDVDIVAACFLFHATGAGSPFGIYGYHLTIDEVKEKGQEVEKR